MAGEEAHITFSGLKHQGDKTSTSTIPVIFTYVLFESIISTAAPKNLVNNSPGYSWKLWIQHHNTRENSARQACPGSETQYKRMAPENREVVMWNPGPFQNVESAVSGTVYASRKTSQHKSKRQKFTWSGGGSPPHPIDNSEEQEESEESYHNLYQARRWMICRWLLCWWNQAITFSLKLTQVSNAM